MEGFHFVISHLSVVQGLPWTWLLLGFRSFSHGSRMIFICSFEYLLLCSSPKPPAPPKMPAWSVPAAARPFSKHLWFVWAGPYSNMSMEFGNSWGEVSDLPLSIPFSTSSKHNWTLGSDPEQVTAPGSLVGRKPQLGCSWGNKVAGNRTLALP